MKNVVAKVHEIVRHRNGVGGAPFYAVRFLGGKDVEGREFIATVFDEQGCCAVLAVDHLDTEGVAFGVNSRRGDRFEPELRAAIAKQNDNEENMPFSLPSPKA